MPSHLKDNGEKRPSQAGGYRVKEKDRQVSLSQKEALDAANT